MWGVAGISLGIKGMPYLITSPLSETISPIKFAKIYTSQVKEMKKLFPVLENYVDASYTGAVRMLSLAGFRLDPVTINNNDFFKFSMVGD
jgi:hypothetical protein